jgi:hypothetical protein
MMKKTNKVWLRATKPLKNKYIILKLRPHPVLVSIPICEIKKIKKSGIYKKLPNLMDKDGCGEVCPLVLPGVARSGRQQVTRAPAHSQRLPHPVPEQVLD